MSDGPSIANCQAESMLQSRFLYPLFSCFVISLFAPLQTVKAEKPPAWIHIEELKDDAEFQLQGEYVAPGKGMQIVAQGEDEFLVVVYEGGLPGAGWNKKPPQRLEIFFDDAEAMTEGYEKIQRVSPTMGAAAPDGAVVLFDGTKETFEKQWQPGARISEDGLLKEGATSVQTFRDYELHAEFLLSYCPLGRGQLRSNSGIYHQGRYETQVLDSFGLEGKMNETGGIYTVRDPDLNMCFPPLTWQTYDVSFKSARFDESGKKLSNAKLTVRVNGVLVQSEIEAPGITRAAPNKETPEPGPIFIQNHGDPLRFRNIWVLPVDAEKEARRPVVLGFERNLASRRDGTNAGGELLFQELACAKCHSGPFETTVDSKAAPRLNEVHKRLLPEYVQEFLANPHHVKPGTTMPVILPQLSAAERAKKLEPIVHYLFANGIPEPSAALPKLARSGKKLFHTMGCVACHGEQEKTYPAGSVLPLISLEKKYTVKSLTEFLKAPHQVRPSARMPKLVAEDKEASELAHYLMRNMDSSMLQENVHYTLYEGRFREMPDFSTLKPKSQGKCYDFDYEFLQREHNYAVVFEATLDLKTSGRYTFRIGSDDGSMLYLNGEKLIDHDGIHPHTTKEKSVDLEQGLHKVEIQFFQEYGGQSIEAQLKAPGQSMRALINFVQRQPVETKSDDSHPGFELNPNLIAEGKQLFASVGCANCHEREDQSSKPSLMAISNSGAGCLAANPKGKAVDFELGSQQKSALTAFLKAETHKRAGEDWITQSLVTFQCTACHQRDGFGGPDSLLNASFQTKVKELGDEVRLPPMLNGIGDKLKPEWIEHVLKTGEKVRPYMEARMPVYQNDHVLELGRQFVAVDQKTETKPVDLEEPVHRTVGSGRHLVGSNGLSCVKCHTYGSFPPIGAQALNLLKVTNRIREDWFHRYLVEPAKFRPGTRMPSSFLNGVSADKDTYHADPLMQTTAIWEYLKAGSKAGVPIGIVPDPIELIPTESPIIYRNFIEGVSPRGIAVGFPEKVHYAWDADLFALRLVWHGQFIDASKHWRGRGQGFQNPMGNHLLKIEEQVPVAVLESQQQAWPEEKPKSMGYQFGGYTLNAAKQPAFHYASEAFQVTDALSPDTSQTEGELIRKLTIEARNGKTVFARLLSGNKIEQIDGNWYQLNESLKISIDSSAAPILRDSNGHKELIVPVNSNSAQTLTIRYRW